MKPDISVIIPIYKTEKYIGKCLESVLAQSKENIEIICVDDQSPDNSAEIVRQYARQDSRIRLVVHEENLGLGGARNTAIRMARADYLASVDSDDQMKPEMLETLYAAAEGGRVDVVACGFERVDENGNVLSVQRHKEEVVYNKNNDINIFRTSNPAFWNKLWKRSLYVDNNIYFPNYVYYQDSATTPRILAKSKVIKTLNQSLYRYLIRDDSATYTYSPKHVLDYLSVYGVVKRFLVDNGLEARYKDEFEEFLNTTMRYHSGNVMSSDMSSEQKSEYLKQLLLLKWSYTEFDDLVKDISNEKKQELLSRSSSKQELIGHQRVLDLSVIVKTFNRPEMLKRFLLSAAEYQEHFGVLFKEIVVGDDSVKEDIEANERTIRDILAVYPSMNVVHDAYEFNIGLSDARNRMVARASSEYVLLCDDDFIVDAECDLDVPLGMIKQKSLDILGGWLKNQYNIKTGEYKYWGSVGEIQDHREEMVVYLNESSQEVPEFAESDFLLNFFVAKRASLQEIGWNPQLKIEEHYDFFLRFYRSHFKAGFTNKLFVKHTNERPNNPKRYTEHRFEKKKWEEALYRSMEAIGKKRRTVNRWRDGHFISWQTDLEKRTNVEIRHDLKEPVLCQRVAVKRVTPQYRNCFFGYYDLQAVSQDGRYHLCQTAPTHDRLPSGSESADVLLIDAEDHSVKKIGETNAWCHQQGAQLQFRANRKSEVIYNYYDGFDAEYRSVTVNYVSGCKKIHPKPVAALSPCGQYALSLNFPRLLDYRAGYGYANKQDPHFHELAPSNDGVYWLDLDSNESRLIVSLKELRERFIVKHFPLHEQSKVAVNHVCFNTDGSKIMMLFRVFSDQAPFPTFTLTCNPDGSGLRRIFGFTSHYHWKDADTLILSGTDVYNKKKVKKIDVFELNTRNGQIDTVDEAFFKGDGHCSYSPDRTLVLYDSYSSPSFPYRKLQVYDVKSRRGIDLGYFYSHPQWHGNNADCRCDLHPRWSPDGRSITFDSMHEGFRGVYSLDVAEVRAAIEAEAHMMTEADLRLWYSAKYAPKKSVAVTTAPAKPKAVAQTSEVNKKEKTEQNTLPVVASVDKHPVPSVAPHVGQAKEAIGSSVALSVVQDPQGEQTDSPFYTLERRMLGKMLNSRKSRKLANDRDRFFADSKSKMANLYGKVT